MYLFLLKPTLLYIQMGLIMYIPRSCLFFFLFAFRIKRSKIQNFDIQHVIPLAGLAAHQENQRARRAKSNSDVLLILQSVLHTLSIYIDSLSFLFHSKFILLLSL